MIRVGQSFIMTFFESFSILHLIYRERLTILKHSFPGQLEDSICNFVYFSFYIQKTLDNYTYSVYKSSIIATTMTIRDTAKI